MSDLGRRVSDSQALKFCRELDGDTSILLVEPYLQLAQASFGLRRYKQCQEYLALARWIVLNAEECTDLTRSRLHQLCGRLYATQGEYIYMYIYIICTAIFLYKVHKHIINEIKYHSFIVNK